MMPWPWAAGDPLTADSLNSLVLTGEKTTNTSRNNTSTLVSDAELVVELEANSKYVFQLLAFYNGASATPDVKFTFTVPSGSSIIWAGFGLGQSATAETGDGRHVVTSVSGQTRAFGTVNGDAGGLMMGRVTTGATAGNLQTQWGQDVATAENTTLLAGTILTAWKVP